MTTPVSAAFISPEKAAHILRCSERKVAEMLKNGELPGVQLGLSWVIPVSAFVFTVGQMAMHQSKARRDAKAAETEPVKRHPGRPRKVKPTT